MNILLACTCGIIVTIMTVFNGQLSTWVGIYLATTLIHLIGLVTFITVMKIKRKKIILRLTAPLFYYTGGCIGVITVLFNVISVSAIGVALLTAFSLFGQMFASFLLEQNGWLLTVKSRITLTKCMGLVIVAIGIGVMLI